MMSNATGTPIQDASLAGGILAGIARDLGTLLGHDLVLASPALERVTSRPAGQGQVHISFKLGLEREGAPRRYGALLVPLPDAITMATYLLMIPEETVAVRREETSLDPMLKDALLEIGNMIGAASHSALVGLGASGWSLRSEGCQGVRPDVRPAFPYQEGSELVVARTSARFEAFPPFELILMLPPLD